ncbi:uncharacterized protein LOC141527587 [Cotesia typhae]|uniref:uncharacterized protein LOC141527587 n=1 Tax=Cotesia typhae TaxID=2053667 RepID=UPI003D69C98A
MDSFVFRNYKKEMITATNLYFFDEEFVEQLCPFDGLIFVDGTFDAVPNVRNNNNMQFLSILAKITSNGCTKAFPVFWVLMTNKMQECYLKAFQFFLRKFPTFQPRESITDHEIAMRNALKIVYPAIISRTCYFHYSQALVKNALDKKVMKTTSSTLSNPETLYIINLLKYLSLLPANCITKTYEAIKKEATESFADFLDDYFKYFEDQWLQKEGAVQISNFDRLEDRTTNIIESYHSQLNRLVEKHPDCNKFLGTLILILREERIDLHSLLSGNYIQPPQTKNQNKITRNNENRIVEILIQNVKETYEEKYQFENYEMYAAINDPENTSAIMQHVKNIRRKLVTSTDPAILFTVYDAPKAPANSEEVIKDSPELAAPKYYKYYIFSE